MQDAKEPEPERSYAMESSGCISLMDGDGQPSFLGCMLSCMERPVTEDEGAKPSQAAGDILAQAEVEERKGNYSAASELYRRALRLIHPDKLTRAPMAQRVAGQCALAALAQQHAAEYYDGVL